MSQSPGMRNLPRPSMTRAPGGTSIEDAGPSAVIRFPRMTTVRSERGSGLRPSITLTCVNAVAVPCAEAFPRQPAHSTAARNTLNAENADITFQSVPESSNTSSQILLRRGNESFHLVHRVVQVRCHAKPGPILATAQRRHNAFLLGECRRETPRIQCT